MTGQSLNGWNGSYIDTELYERYKQDPTSVASDLRAFFQGFELAAGEGAAMPRASGAASRFQSAVDDLVNAYRDLGHLAARTDPFDRSPQRPAELTMGHYGLGEADLDRTVDSKTFGVKGDQVTVKELLQHLERTYCQSIGVEFMHIQDGEQRQWILDRFEASEGRIPLTPDDQKHILEQLIRSESFEKFLAKRYTTEKRFSLEGAEAAIPLLDRLISAAADTGVAEITMGMAHRGRLNVLNNILGKTYEQIFTEFEDNWEAGFADGGGDVKYHRGYSGTRALPGGRSVHLAMASNPSHLESVNPVVLGRCRAKQMLRNDTERRVVIPVLIHGDAAIAGQGMIAECFNLSQLEGYTAGGCVHLVINNLIGFTTVPEDARSTRYCTDVAKMIDAPIFHVNGMDPEAVVAVAQLALDFRQRFRRDVVIDMLCYRKYGHNEGDEQSFTNPILAGLIRQQKPVLQRYEERLRESGQITAEALKEITDRLDQVLDAAQAAAKRKPHDPTIDPGSQRWKNMTGEFSFAPVNTAVSAGTLREVCEALARVPEGFNVNPKLKGLLQTRAELYQSDGITHADAEMLAFGTLLLESTHVRVSGQDSRRGTFTQRHAVLRDLQSGEPYVSLNHMREMGTLGTESAPGTAGADGRARQADFAIYDSPLSEYSVVGFDYGYSLADPNVLVCWEAQFGDFCNGAQVLIDQYLAPAELKWQRWSGLVMLLPHGYEGAGPEHSSARMERFLQLCGDDNLEVVYPSTAGQMFHVLRRQIKSSFRKPLIVMTPKGMLRTPTSPVSEFTGGRFHEIIDDPAFARAGAADRKAVKRIVLCSGKIYHELAERRQAIGRRDIALIRIEQLYPFHASLAREILSQYSGATERLWCQEEPRNIGAYFHISDVCRTQLGFDPVYIGRAPSATPAVGSKSVHKKEQEAIITSAVGPLPKGVAKGETPESKAPPAPEPKKTPEPPARAGKAARASV